MKILVLGSGGREHALIWKLAQSPSVEKIYAAPGNGGISQLAECISISADDVPAISNFAETHSIGLTVVGPEGPLSKGIVDEFQRRRLRIFGPEKKAAELEWSKSFAKQIMKKYHIPTADYEIFYKPEDAEEYLKNSSYPLVVKADGLAAGKGVTVCNNEKEAKTAIEESMVQKVFGDAGRQVVIEECLIGEEVSILALTDGKDVLPLASSQDHKQVSDGDAGPNTGGMGAYSPAPVVPDKMMGLILKNIINPLLDGMKSEGRVYKGVLYAGLMLTEQGPKVLEFNVRFGDPETQSILPRLKNDLAEVLEAVVDERLIRVKLNWDARPCVCVVVASGGYPGSYQKGKPITGLNEASTMKDVVVFHAGTKKVSSSPLVGEGKGEGVPSTPVGEGKGEGVLVTDGGRVLGVTALGEDFISAQRHAYDAVQKIHFEAMHFRKDIAHRAIKKI